VVTDPQTNKQTHTVRDDYNTLRRSLARSVMKTRSLRLADLANKFPVMRTISEVNVVSFGAGG